MLLLDNLCRISGINEKSPMSNRDHQAARILWSYLKNRRLGGFEFTHAPVYSDLGSGAFVCPEVRVIVRVGRRDITSELAWQDEMIAFHRLLQKGMVLLSFHPEHIVRDIDHVLSMILDTAQARARHWRETVVRNN